MAALFCEILFEVYSRLNKRSFLMNSNLAKGGNCTSTSKHPVISKLRQDFEEIRLPEHKLS